MLSAGFSDDEVAGIARLLAAHVLASAQPDARTAAGLSAEALGDFPHLHRVAPAYARLSEQDVFELGVEIILDGLGKRLSRTASPG
ncbi:TetR/AcrR family transcriptional regulator C-terminal domain-containing protein [Allokutzneria sp. A3M-2-11 16]|uniref:TetR/AcrR family transcriptional regulator C-terminal domain-containing protein n=1 Tax=Allokutzneria sp. A3M-2-11 16 TaxID=2962043 RepID=UPI0020B863A5|nr:TetR/AcrR family transcriptional regulator C-terminal domain-containing protein [Allokutzneria sp. A3M-2-11 16]MCP3800292.1 TetR/AcrR family transcriptional regulator C-terminal domain-containing protein [Allokutzneria sp. A3M-2-11 16]